jgi:hypothetical protein
MGRAGEVLALLYVLMLANYLMKEDGIPVSRLSAAIKFRMYLIAIQCYQLKLLLCPCASRLGRQTNYKSFLWDTTGKQ